MSRAHAHKAARDKNANAGKDDLDAGINMGLYNYPILMAADILIMGAEVPVGKDQSQHVEYAAEEAGAMGWGELKELLCEVTLRSTDDARQRARRRAHGRSSQGPYSYSTTFEQRA